ncbi:MAG: cupin domain-containing protein [Candidatus Methylacidiphilales bacterium]|nr:cupin domain-containing protein [Candidatus Methylacidiphilales bacterium]
MSSPHAAASLIVHPPGIGKTWSAAGDRYTILADADQTAGAYCLLEATVPPGGGPPPHFHTREEETFYVLEGEITFTAGDRTIVAKPGSFLQIPRGTLHSFKNLSGKSARMLIHCLPAGFDRFLAEVGTELPSAVADPIPPGSADFERLLAVAPNYGIVIKPPDHGA